MVLFYIFSIFGSLNFFKVIIFHADPFLPPKYFHGKATMNFFSVSSLKKDVDFKG